MDNIAHKRIEGIFDRDSFHLMDDLNPTLHILGYGLINGKKVYCFSGIKDPDRINLIECFKRKIKWMESIIKDPAPVIWIHDNFTQTVKGQTPIPKSSDVLLASKDISIGRGFFLQTKIGNLCPQFSILYGNAGAAQTFPVRIADFVLLHKDSKMWIGRPDAVKLMLGSMPDPEDLGGSNMHCIKSGNGDMLFSEDEEAFNWIRSAIDILPLNINDKSRNITKSKEPSSTIENIYDVIPENLNSPFDMKILLNALVDEDSLTVIKQLYAQEVITGLARINGNAIGIVANNSKFKGGVIFTESLKKINQFMELCNKHKIPLLFLVDNPGLMVGTQSEQSGLLNETCRLFKNFSLKNSPRICLIIRKAYTVGLYAMGGSGFEPDQIWALPKASISVFGPKALESFSKNRDLTEDTQKAIDEMYRHATNPQDYLDLNFIDKIIQWNEIREKLSIFLSNI